MRYFVLVVIPAMTWVGILRYDRVLNGFSDKFLFANLTIIGICSLILFAKYYTKHSSDFAGFAAIILNLFVVFAISNSKEIHYVNIGILFCLSLIFLSSLNFPRYISFFLVLFI